MKIGDLVTLAWGEHPRRVGMIVALRRGSIREHDEANISWFEYARVEHYMLKSLELVDK
tara:strand:+ start:98 stop:274 length:177 start_codon:yes stop_codon:yes gene_type:complete